ncbi:MAG TPA: hypothetical protein VJ793_23640 [Anaerolineae bacterium]|nr:hypothetical protein [Anaerolineae bacterium]
MSPALYPLLWVLNGLLVVVYFIVDHLAVALMIPVLVWLGVTAPREQQKWFAVAASGALVTAVIAPTPVPILMLVMAAGGALAAIVERFNPAAIRWLVTRGLAFYSLIGLAFMAYQAWLRGQPAGGMGPFAGGQQYIDIIASIAVYAFPLGVLGWMAQTIFAHPPTLAKPTDMMYAIRSRGKEER